VLGIVEETVTKRVRSLKKNLKLARVCRSVKT